MSDGNELTGPFCANCKRIVVRRQRVVEMAREGLSSAQMAQDLKVTVQTINRDRVALGISLPAPIHLSSAPIERKSFLRASQKRREEVARMTRAGLTASQIAERLKTTTRTVSRDRVILGIDQPKVPVMTPEEQEVAQQMLEDGYPYTEVARTLGRHDTTIAKRFPGMSQVKGGQLARTHELQRRLGLL